MIVEAGYTSSLWGGQRPSQRGYALTCLVDEPFDRILKPRLEDEMSREDVAGVLLA